MTEPPSSDPTGASFSSLVAPLLPGLHAFIYRMVAHPEDAKDIVQDTLLSAHQNIASYRGEATFRTWLFSIATRKSLDHLRARKRWPANAQSLGAKAHLQSSDLMAEIGAVASRPGFRYEYREHIAYCFSCIGRSLPPIEAAAVFLRDVFEFSNEEAAIVVGLSVSTFRHRLASGRAQMIETFDNRCALVKKEGVCWQCKALQTHLPPERRGPEVQTLRQADTDDREDLFRRRLAIVREVERGEKSTKELHDYFLRFMNDFLEG